MVDPVDRHHPKADGPDFSLEQAALAHRPDLFASADRIVIGVDEAGRGPWAGPVTAAAAWIDPDHHQSLPSGLNDSKKLTAAKRQTLFQALQTDRERVQANVASASVETIDRLGILKATFSAMDDAATALLQHHDPDIDVVVLVDGNLSPPFQRLTALLARPPVIQPIIKGDSRSLSIAAASIMAKEIRDAIMVELDHQWPGYGWAENKGYGTAAHQSALAKQGVTPHHRRSFKPIQMLISE